MTQLTSARSRWIAILSFFLTASSWAASPTATATPASPSIAVASDSVSFHLPVPDVEKLPNGLTIAWFLSDRIPVLDLALLIQSGFRDDPKGKSGTAELVSASIDRGSAGRSAADLSLEVERLGASRYSGASDDTFTLGAHGLAPDGAQLLDILARFALKPNFEEGEIRREQGRMLERWKRLGDSPEALAGLAFARSISAGTDYARGGTASTAELARLSPGDVRAYYGRHFTPGNAVLMVVGRADRADFRRRILESFGNWSGPAPRHQRVPYSDPRLKIQPHQVLVVDRPGSTQAQVRMGFRIPGIRSPGRYPLAVVNAMLGEYFNSRLNSLLRDQLGLTYGISSAVDYERDLAHLGIGAATRTEATGELIERAIAVLKGMKTEPILEEETHTAKDYLVGGFPLGVSTLGAVASRWLAGYVFDLGPDYLNEFIPSISRVTAADASGVARQDFDLDHLIIVVSGDSAEIAKSLKARKISFKRVTAKDLM